MNGEPRTVTYDGGTVCSTTAISVFMLSSIRILEAFPAATKHKGIAHMTLMRVSAKMVCVSELNPNERKMISVVADKLAMVVAIRFRIVQLSKTQRAERVSFTLELEIDRVPRHRYE